MTAIEEIQDVTRKIADGDHESIKPGMPTRMTEALVPGDCVRQGDLYLEVVSIPPDGYKKVDRPKMSDRQLVPGSTRGAKHALDSLRGVTMFRPSGWPQSAEEDFLGPCFTLAEERTVTHPIHGSVTIAAGHAILCSYQRDYEAASKVERRNAD